MESFGCWGGWWKPVKRDDGRWMSDTTPIIQFFESEHPTPPVQCLVDFAYPSGTLGGVATKTPSP